MNCRSVLHVIFVLFIIGCSPVEKPGKLEFLAAADMPNHADQWPQITLVGYDPSGRYLAGLGQVKNFNRRDLPEHYLYLWKLNSKGEIVEFEELGLPKDCEPLWPFWQGAWTPGGEHVVILCKRQILSFNLAEKTFFSSEQTWGQNGFKAQGVKGPSILEGDQELMVVGKLGSSIHELSLLKLSIHSSSFGLYEELPQIEAPPSIFLNRNFYLSEEEGPRWPLKSISLVNVETANSTGLGTFHSPEVLDVAYNKALIHDPYGTRGKEGGEPTFFLLNLNSAKLEKLPTVPTSSRYPSVSDSYVARIIGEGEGVLLARNSDDDNKQTTIEGEVALFRLENGQWSEIALKERASFYIRSMAVSPGHSHVALERHKFLDIVDFSAISPK